MIHGKLSTLSHYRKLHPNFAIAIDWLLKQDIDKLKDGKFSIHGDDVYAIKTVVKSYDDNDVQHEVHHQYADIQVILDPEEKFFYDSEAEMGSSKGKFDEKNDCELFHLKHRTHIVKPRVKEFLIFLPHEGHAPKYVGKVRDLHKLIVKVKYSHV